MDRLCILLQRKPTVRFLQILEIIEKNLFFLSLSLFSLFLSAFPFFFLNFSPFCFSYFLFFSFIFIFFLVLSFPLFPPLDTWLNVSHSHKCTTCHAMCHPTLKFRLSRNSTKFDEVTRFRELNSTVKSVSSSEVYKIFSFQSKLPFYHFSEKLNFSRVLHFS